MASSWKAKGAVRPWPRRGRESAQHGTRASMAARNGASAGPPGPVARPAHGARSTPGSTGNIGDPARRGRLRQCRRCRADERHRSGRPRRGMLSDILAQIPQDEEIATVNAESPADAPSSIGLEPMAPRWETPGTAGGTQDARACHDAIAARGAAASGHSSGAAGGCAINGVDGPSSGIAMCRGGSCGAFRREEPSMEQPIAIGLDPAKGAFQVRGAAADGRNARSWKPDTAGARARNGILRASKHLGRALRRTWSGHRRRSRGRHEPDREKLRGPFSPAIR